MKKKSLQPYKKCVGMVISQPAHTLDLLIKPMLWSARKGSKKFFGRRQIRLWLELEKEGWGIILYKYHMRLLKSSCLWFLLVGLQMMVGYGDGDSAALADVSSSLFRFMSMQIHIFYFDHQRQVWVYFYYFVDIRQCVKEGPKPFNITYKLCIWLYIATMHFLRAKWLLFPTSPLLLRHETCNLYEMLSNPSRGCSHFS